MWARGKIVWSPVEVDYLRVHRDEPVFQLTIALAKSANAIRNKVREIDGKPVATSSRKTISRLGKRKDLGLFMRSGWEANVARYFKSMNQEFLYEPKVFVFEKFKHGTVSYVPDFRLEFPSRDGQYHWIEVKGFLKGVDKTKIRRFKKFFPEEFARLRAICNPKTKAEAFFQEMGVPIISYYKDLNKEFKAKLPNWE